MMPTDEYEKYERTCKKIRAENATLLSDFEQWLAKKGLAENTIRQHIEKVELYVNTFLLYEEVVPAKDGVSQISMFLGYWFIRKVMWSIPNSIKQNAASLKKFYTFMHEQGQIKAGELQYLKETIKEEMPEWIGTVDLTNPSDRITRLQWSSLNTVFSGNAAGH